MYVTRDAFKGIFNNSFIINYPKEIVSGDFYWLNEKNGKTILALADCTGHGVPGALLSTLGYSMLNNIVLNESITAPDQILKRLWMEWRKTFVNQNKLIPQYDGMEIAICSIDYKTEVIEFSALGGDMMFIQNGVLVEYKGEQLGRSSNSLTAITESEIEALTSHEIPFAAKDVFYLFSDGYRDQFGGEKNEKFSKNKFRELISGCQIHTMEDQGRLIDETFLKWKGTNSQIDDVLVIGVQL